MSAHHQHPHPPAAQAGPPEHARAQGLAAPRSLLMGAAGGRVAAAVVVMALLWAAVAWALAA
jgi:hypothetical protein